MLLLLLACAGETTVDSGDYAPIQDLDGDGVISSLDCNDTNPNVGLPGLYWTDNDGDGFGAGDVFESCVPLVGTADEGGDCDDANPTLNPGESEVACSGLDEDCSGVADAGMTVGTHFDTLYQALNAASPGDVVCLPAGTWLGGFDMPSGVTLMGQGQGETYLQSDGSGPVVTATGDLTLMTMTLRGGTTLVDTVPDSVLRLEAVEIGAMALSTEKQAHLLQLDGGRLELLDVSIPSFFLETQASADGLLFDLGTADLAVRNLNLADLDVVSAGTADGVLFRGTGGDWTIVGLFSDLGRMASAGSGSLMHNQGGAVTLDQMTWIDSGFESGGDLRFIDLEQGSLVAERIQVDNISLTAPGLTTVLSLREMDSVASQNLTLIKTRIQSSGSACLIEVVGGGSTLLQQTAWYDTTLDLPDNTGGLLCASESAQVFIQNAAMAANQANVEQMGPWLDAVNSDVSLSQVDMVGNRVSGENGTAYAMIGGESATWSVHNTSFVGNEAVATVNQLGANVFHARDQAVTLIWGYSNVWDNSGMPLDFGQGNGLEWESVDTLSADPDYVRTTGDDPLQWDLYLNSGSPMFDAGDPDLVDWYDSSRSDVGAFGGAFGAWRP